VGGRPRDAERDPVRAAWRHSVAHAATGARVRLGRHMLEAAARVARPGRLAEAPPAHAGAPGRGRPDRLDAGEPGQPELGREKGGAGVGPEPDRQGQARARSTTSSSTGGRPARRRGDRGATCTTAACWRRSDAVVPVRTGPARPPPAPPAKLHADKGYDYRRCRDACVRAASSTGSRGRGSRPRTRWVGTAGSWSARWRGWPATAGSRSGTSASLTARRLPRPRLRAHLLELRPAVVNSQ
jgi:hypothetical protein